MAAVLQMVGFQSRCSFTGCRSHDTRLTISNCAFVALDSHLLDSEVSGWVVHIAHGDLSYVVAHRTSTNS